LVSILALLGGVATGVRGLDKLRALRNASIGVISLLDEMRENAQDLPF
tara:strand:+ start:704 stop:847 length:144 start_codon:yes stop_codon:yes gene_type:complete